MNFPPDLDKSRHKLCLDARDAARRAAEGIELIESDLVLCDTGQRVSRSNGSSFRLQGFVGEVEFSGDLEAVLHWLSALTLGGGGTKRPWGFGRVRVEWLFADYTGNLGVFVRNYVSHELPKCSGQSSVLAEAVRLSTLSWGNRRRFGFIPFRANKFPSFGV